MVYDGGGVAHWPSNACEPSQATNLRSEEGAESEEEEEEGAEE